MLNGAKPKGVKQSIQDNGPGVLPPAVIGFLLMLAVVLAVTFVLAAALVRTP